MEAKAGDDHGDQGDESDGGEEDEEKEVSCDEEEIMQRFSNRFLCEA